MILRSRRPLGLAGLFVATVASGMTAPVAAETISISGHVPASTDVAIGFEVIAVEPLDGSVGGKLGFELKEALASVRPDGVTWFDLAAGPETPVDAVIQGVADEQSSITELDRKEVRTCKKRNEEKKCIAYKVTYYDCNRFSVAVYPDIELVGRDGEVLYAARDELTRSIDHCDDAGSRPSPDAISDGLISGFAEDVRRALAPRSSKADYRVMERRKGLEKENRRAFKQALKLTKSDENAACKAFLELQTSAPGQVSVLYNAALCHERAGEYERASALYGTALELEPDKAMTLQALERVDAWERGRDQLAIRADIVETRYGAFQNEQEVAGE